MQKKAFNQFLVKIIITKLNKKNYIKYLLLEIKPVDNLEILLYYISE